MPDLPHGTVAFLFTDIEGSTRLWQTQRAAMERAYTRHDALLRAAITAHRGVVYKLIRRHRGSPQYGLPDVRRIG